VFFHLRPGGGRKTRRMRFEEPAPRQDTGAGSAPRTGFALGRATRRHDRPAERPELWHPVRTEAIRVGLQSLSARAGLTRSENENRRPEVRDQGASARGSSPAGVKHAQFERRRRADLRTVLARATMPGVASVPALRAMSLRLAGVLVFLQSQLHHRRVPPPGSTRSAPTSEFVPSVQRRKAQPVRGRTRW